MHCGTSLNLSKLDMSKNDGKEYHLVTDIAVHIYMKQNLFSEKQV